MEQCQRMKKNQNSPLPNFPNMNGRKEPWPQIVTDLPLGKIVGVAALFTIRRTERMGKEIPITLQELAFGDYGPGRFAWEFTSPVMLDEPIDYRGKLGLWPVDQLVRKRLAEKTGRYVDLGISLTQPWATLLAGGEKRQETRSWSTSVRGFVAIHAAQTFPRQCRELCFRDTTFLAALARIAK
jgi:hypothetical protein